MRDRRYEQGGVVSFVIIAVILATLLGAGIWWAKQFQATGSTTTPGSSTNSGTGTSQNTQEGSTNNSTSGGSTTTPSGGTGTDTTTGSSTSGTGSTSGGNVASTGPSVSEVPSTGPSEVIMTALLLSGGSALAYYVVQSHRRLRASALK